MRNIRFETRFSTGIPQNLAERFFNIERDTFGEVYERCPRTHTEFDSRYKGRSLYLVLARLDDEVVGQRTFQFVNDEHVESMFMVVQPSFRGLGISSAICWLSAAWLSWQGFRWVSSWTHIDITAAAILDRFAPLQSTAPDLDNVEIRRLREIESRRGLKDGSLGFSRIVKDYYVMRDGRTGDARYWVHRLPQPRLGLTHDVDA